MFHRRSDHFSLLLLAASLLLLQGCSGNGNGETVPVKKETAADFTLKLFDGGSFRLSDYKGKPVLINFWASSCIICREEAPALERSYQEYSKNGVVFIGIAIYDTETKAREFVKEFQLSFPIGIDSSREIEKSYRVYGVPTTFFIDKKGLINYLHLGGVSEELLSHELDKLL